MSQMSVMSPVTPGGVGMQQDLGFAASKSAQADRHRRTMLGLGGAMFCWGFVGMIVSFSWVSNILTLICGAVILSITASEDRTRRHFQTLRNTGCCGVDSIRGLAISLIVFGALEVLAFGIFAILLYTVLVFLLASLAIANQQAAGAGAAVVVTYDASRIRYLQMAFTLAPLWPIVSITLAGVVLCTVDPFIMSSNAAYALSSSASPGGGGSTTVVVNLASQASMGAFSPQQQQPQQQVYAASPVYGQPSPHPQQQQQAYAQQQYAQQQYAQQQYAQQQYAQQQAYAAQQQQQQQQQQQHYAGAPQYSALPPPQGEHASPDAVPAEPPSMMAPPPGAGDAAALPHKTV